MNALARIALAGVLALSTAAQAQVPTRADPVETEEMKRTADLCHIKRLCANYGAARQQCAVAGNFDNCVSVKMGDDLWKVSICTKEGGMVNSPADLPNFAQCLIPLIKEYLN